MIADRELGRKWDKTKDIATKRFDSTIGKDPWQDRLNKSNSLRMLNSLKASMSQQQPNPLRPSDSLPHLTQTSFKIRISDIGEPESKPESYRDPP